MKLLPWKFILMVGCLFLLQVSCEKNVEDNEPDNTPCEDISFSSDIMPIINAKCIQCHGGNSQIPDLRTYQGVKNNAQKVKELTTSRIMPQQGTLSNVQIEMIACWVDMGAQNN